MCEHPEKMRGCLDRHRQLSCLTRPQTFAHRPWHLAPTSAHAFHTWLLGAWLSPDNEKEKRKNTEQFRARCQSPAKCPARLNLQTPRLRAARGLLDSDPHGSGRAFSDAPSPWRRLGHNVALSCLDFGDLCPVTTAWRKDS